MLIIIPWLENKIQIAQRFNFSSSLVRNFLKYDIFDTAEAPYSKNQLKTDKIE